MEYSNRERPVRDRTPWAVSGYYFFSLGGFAIASPYLPLYWKSLGFNGAALGALLTALGLGGLLAQAPMGYLSDRGGQRRELVFGAMTLAALVMLAYPLYHSFWALFIATLVISAMYRSCDALMQAVVGDWAAGTEMASTYGRLRMFGSIGWVVSLLISARVAFMTDWRVVPNTGWLAPMFLVITGFWLMAGSSALLAKRVNAPERLRVGPWTALKTVARAPGVGRFLVAFALYWTGLQSISAFFSLHLLELGASHATISTAFVISAVAETPVIYLAGRWADLWGERTCLAIAFGILPLRLVLDAVLPSAGWLLATQAMHSVTYGLMMVGSVAYVNHRLPGSLRASGQGALGAVMSMAATAAPFIGAFVADAAGYRAVFAVMAVLVVIGWIVSGSFPMIRRPRRREDSRMLWESDSQEEVRDVGKKTRPLPMGDEYGGFLLLNIFDLFLTGYIFRHGGEEVNPVGIHVMERYGMGGFALFKFGMVALVIIVAEIVYRLRPARARSLMTSANLIYFGVILWECILLWYRFK